MSQITEMIVTIATAIVGLGIVSVLVSRNAQTSSVIQSAASGFSNAIATAQAPVTGSTLAINLSYPNSYGSSFGSAGY